MRGGRMRPIKFPATVAVIEHPREGVILFDTGYSPRFFEQTKYFPNKFYALTTPVTIAPEMTALAQLARRGIAVRDVKHVILSHFHADHIGGAGDFPHATYIYRGSSYDAVKGLTPWKSLMAGFLGGLLPEDFQRRSRPLGDSDFRVGNYGFHEFSNACDVFGDGQILAVDLPGHAAGQIGLLVHDGSGARFFLVADAAWLGRSFQENRAPLPLMKLIFDDWKVYGETLGKIHALAQRDSALKIVPCHCDRTFHELKRD